MVPGCGIHEDRTVREFVLSALSPQHRHNPLQKLQIPCVICFGRRLVLSQHAQDNPSRALARRQNRPWGRRLPGRCRHPGQAFLVCGGASHSSARMHVQESLHLYLSPLAGPPRYSASGIGSGHVRRECCAQPAGERWTAVRGPDAALMRRNARSYPGVRLASASITAKSRIPFAPHPFSSEGPRGEIAHTDGSLRLKHVGRHRFRQALHVLAHRVKVLTEFTRQITLDLLRLDELALGDRPRAVLRYRYSHATAEQHDIVYGTRGRRLWWRRLVASILGCGIDTQADALRVRGDPRHRLPKGQCRVARHTHALGHDRSPQRQDRRTVDADRFGLHWAVMPASVDNAAKRASWYFARRNKVLPLMIGGPDCRFVTRGDRCGQAMRNLGHWWRQRSVLRCSR